MQTETCRKNFIRKLPLTLVRSEKSSAWLSAGTALRLWSAAADGKVTVWNLQGHGSRTLTLDSRAPADLLNDAPGAAWPVVAFSPDGNTIAESARCSVRLWNPEGGSHEPSKEVNLEVNQDAHLGMAFSADGK